MKKYTFEEIKCLLMKSIWEYKCEAELSLYFEDNPNMYMIIIYKDHCSFQRCGSRLCKGSGELNFTSLDELFESNLIDGICLKNDWDRITDFDCMEFDMLHLW